MPFKSKAQMRKFFSMESKGELPKGTAEHWAHETPSVKRLPEKKASYFDYVTLRAKTAAATKYHP
jgi:hypothetical protein